MVSLCGKCSLVESAVASEPTLRNEVLLISATGNSEFQDNFVVVRVFSACCSHLYRPLMTSARLTQVEVKVGRLTETSVCAAF